MKISLRFIAACAAMVLLAAGWLYLYANSRAVNVDEQNAVLASLKDFKQYDSNWNVDVLKSQTDINKSYDPLTQPLAGFAKITKSIDAVATASDDAELQKDARDIHAALDDKMGLIDRFKAQNSLLKNSLRYAPTAHKDIRDRFHAERDAGVTARSRLMKDIPGAFDELEKSLTDSKKSGNGADNSAGSGAGNGASNDVGADANKVNASVSNLREKMKNMQLAESSARGAFALVKLEDNINSLVADVLQFNAVPDAASGEAIKGEIEGMREASATYPANVREQVENLMSHLDAILRLRTEQTALLQTIAQVPLTAAVDAFGGALTKRFDAELAQQYFYQRLLLVYSAVALALVFGSAAVIAYRNATERRRLTVLVEKQTKELKENEVLLIHAQKMRAMGEMVAGITHEINTPLAAVKSGLQSTSDIFSSIGEYVDASGHLVDALLTPVPDDESGRASRKNELTRHLRLAYNLREDLNSFDGMGMIQSLLKDGIASVEHINQVVVNMLNFSRLDRSRVTAMKVEEGIESTLAMAKHLFKNTKLIKRFGETMPVKCDMAQINQVLLNLLKNAVQATSGPDGLIVIETEMPTPQAVHVTIADNGAGIPDEILKKIFEPFFTTKKAGAGTGLGLSTCKKIVAAHGGEIRIASQVGKGSRFTVILPLEPPDSLFEEHGQEKDSKLVTG